MIVNNEFFGLKNYYTPRRFWEEAAERISAARRVVFRGHSAEVEPPIIKRSPLYHFTKAFLRENSLHKRRAYSQPSVPPFPVSGGSLLFEECTDGFFPGGTLSEQGMRRFTLLLQKLGYLVDLSPNPRVVLVSPKIEEDDMQFMLEVLCRCKGNWMRSGKGAGK